MLNVKIKSIGTYHSDTIVTNEDMNRYFDKKGKDIRGFLEGKGRNRRHISNDLDVVTMGINASRQALEKANLQGKDLDMIVFCTDTPPYTTPCCASFIHRALKCKNESSVYDANSNCVSMVLQLDNVARIMTTSKDINRALIVGSQKLFHYTEEPMLKPLFGDSACAVILEKCNDDVSYIIDSLSFTDSDIYQKLLLCKDGVLEFGNLSGENTFYHVSQDIENLLTKTNIDKKDVKKYFITQYALSEMKKIILDLNENSEKFPYIGDEYGYTGVTSPFLALNKSIEDGEIERGSLIVLYSIGSGVVSKGILLRY